MAFRATIESGSIGDASPASPVLSVAPAAVLCYLYLYCSVMMLKHLKQRAAVCVAADAVMLCQFHKSAAAAAAAGYWRMDTLASMSLWSLLVRHHWYCHRHRANSSLWPQLAAHKALCASRTRWLRLLLWRLEKRCCCWR